MIELSVLVPRFVVPGSMPAEDLPTLEHIATSPRTRFAKLYAFVRAMDEIAIEQGLASAMLTLTLEPEFHSNPSSTRTRAMARTHGMAAHRERRTPLLPSAGSRSCATSIAVA